MTSGRGRFLRDNPFLAAAVALPVVIAAFFVAASAIPRWTVPAPAHDLVLRAARYDSSPAGVVVDFAVRSGRVEADVRSAPPHSYPQAWMLFLFDHETLEVREVPLELPASLPEGETRTVVVDALAGRRVSAMTTAPDGYELTASTGGGAGLVGDLFGMGRNRQRVFLARDGRVVSLDLPSPYRNPYISPVYAVGWIIDERR